MAVIKKIRDKFWEGCREKGMEKREPLWTVGGNVNWCSHCGKWYESSSKN